MLTFYEYKVLNTLRLLINKSIDDNSSLDKFELLTSLIPEISEGTGFDVVRVKSILCDLESRKYIQATSGAIFTTTGLIALLDYPTVCKKEKKSRRAKSLRNFIVLAATAFLGALAAGLALEYGLPFLKLLIK